MTVLVLGDGQVGGALRQAVAAHGWPCAVLDRACLDITNGDRVAAEIARYRPWAVINAAAYTAVDRAEAEPEQAMAVNGAGAGHVARAAARAGAILIHLSSDYVFDGRKPSAYVETDAPAPLSAYGLSKLAGEKAVAAAGGRHLIVRSAWLFSAHGHNFVRTMLRRGRERGEVAVVDDQTGCPTPVGALADALLHMLDTARWPSFKEWGIYHVAGAPPVTWHGFAEAIFEAAGATVTVKRTSSASFAAPAARPANSALDCGKAAAAFGLAAIDWNVGLIAVIAELAGTL